MKAYKCDRCGNYYSNEDHDKNGFKFTRNFVMVHGDDWFDLCPECCKKLDQFMGTIWKENRGIKEDIE